MDRSEMPGGLEKASGLVDACIPIRFGPPMAKAYQDEREVEGEKLQK